MDENVLKIVLQEESAGSPLASAPSFPQAQPVGPSVSYASAFAQPVTPTVARQSATQSSAFESFYQAAAQSTRDLIEQGFTDPAKAAVSALSDGLSIAAEKAKAWEASVAKASSDMIAGMSKFGKEEAEKIAAHTKMAAGFTIPDALPGFDPHAEALEMIERRKRAMQIRAQYENITEGPAEIKGPKGMMGQLAESGAFGRLPQLMSGLAETVGPVGVAIGALQIGSMVAVGALRTFTSGVQEAGNATAALARNDLGGMFDAATAGAKSFAETIPIVGKVFSAGIDAAVAPITAFRQSVQAFVDNAHRIAYVSGDISAAEAKARSRGIMADIREAQQLGPSSARLIDAQSEILTQIRDLLLPIKEIVLDFLVVNLEIISTSIKAFAPALTVTRESIIAALEVIANIVDPVKVIHLLEDLPIKIAEAIVKSLLPKQNPLDVANVLADLRNAVPRWKNRPADPLLNPLAFQ